MNRRTRQFFNKKSLLENLRDGAIEVFEAWFDGAGLVGTAICFLVLCALIGVCLAIIVWELGK